MNYRSHPTKETLEKWRDIVSENTKPETTFNPSFELGYWRFGLRTAKIWKERLGLNRNPKWDDVLKKLSPLPLVDGVYVTHENI